MHKINLEVSTRAKIERDKRKERERTQKKHEKGRKKETIFFFNRLRGHRAGKKNWRTCCANKKATVQTKKMARHPQPLTWLRHCQDSLLSTRLIFFIAMTVEPNLLR
jgi:hypothetical protein